jgi:regulator of protease activity HflC (stomatin/prohibitin superfamily)
VVDQQVEPAAPAPPTAAPPAPGAPNYSPQLTQVRVPVSEAADAFAIPDAFGRFPIVVLTGERSRIRNEFVAVGIALGAIAILFDIQLVARSGLIALGVASIVFGVIQSFIVRIPEGAQALTLRRGRFDKVIPAGVHMMPPWIGVTHVVTKRDIPFIASASQIPTADGLRVDLAVLITFAIEGADKFVFAISAPDFDLVCQATAQDAMRRLAREVTSEDVLDLAGGESDALRKAIGGSLAEYGVEVHKVVVVTVRPPADYMASLEARRLAEVQQAEQSQRHALKLLRQSDRDELARRHLEQRRKLLEIEAANESMRLEMLETRISAFPRGAQWDYDTQRMDVARALASNDRALLSFGDAANLTDALIVSDRENAANDSPPVARPRRRPAAPKP